MDPIVVVLKEGYGYTFIILKENTRQLGDCSGWLSMIQLLLNSKVFIEFLCTCRYYIYAANLSKKCPLLLVFSHFIRGTVSVPLCPRYRVRLARHSPVHRRNSLHHLLQEVDLGRKRQRGRLFFSPRVHDSCRKRTETH